jgi:serine/threonine protein kinase/tetratricopeptide (TPR) repeat protein
MNAIDQSTAYEQTPSDRTSATGEADLLVGTVFARKYRVLGRLASGGMGTVYTAEQLQPVRREVALKVIRAGALTASVLARFEQEREALALMEHPNIARVFDAGIEPARHPLDPQYHEAIRTDVPYLAMELIRGPAITDFCRERRLALRDRIALFIAVCQAVQHAHQKGIIHRDLKPSNILIGLYDGRAVPKVIDFGIAKAVPPASGAGVGITQVGCFMGTIHYVSPEQAATNPPRIDTRTDVYSLGVVLYELLTGDVPFRCPDQSPGGMLHFLQVLQDSEPLRPSARRSEQKPTGAPTESHDASWAGRLRGDLDHIVLKALEKNPDRRYATAQDLASDLERYLAGDPVSAVPPTAVYRLRKFIGKHRVTAAAAAITFAALVGGIVATSVALYRVNQERELAESAKLQAMNAFAVADQNATDARRVIDEFLIQIGDEQLSDIPRFEPVRQRLVGLAVTRYRDLLLRQPEHAGLRRDAASTYQRAANLHRMLGQYPQARELYPEALALYRGLAAEQPSVPDHLRGVSAVLTDYGDFLGRVEGPRAACERYAEAHAWAVRYRELAPGSDAPQLTVALALGNWADALRELGRTQEAVERQKESCALLEEIARDTAPLTYRFVAVFAWNNLAKLGRETGQPELARHALKQARERSARLLQEAPENANVRYTAAWRQLETGLFHLSTGAVAEAGTELEQGVGTLESLHKDYPRTVSFRRKLAEALVARSRHRVQTREVTTAYQDATRAVELLDALNAQSPGACLHWAHLAIAQLQCLVCAKARGDDAAVTHHRDQAEHYLREARRVNPDHPVLQRKVE